MARKPAGRQPRIQQTLVRLRASIRIVYMMSGKSIQVPGIVEAASDIAGHEASNFAAISGQDDICPVRPGDPGQAGHSFTQTS